MRYQFDQTPFWREGAIHESKTEKSAVLVIPIYQVLWLGRGGGSVLNSTSLVCHYLVGYYPETVGLASPLSHSDFPLPFQLFFKPSMQHLFSHMYFWCHYNFGQHIYPYNTPVLMSDRLCKSINTVLQNILYLLSAVLYV